jgi:hypothetical protein
MFRFITDKSQKGLWAQNWNEARVIAGLDENISEYDPEKDPSWSSLELLTEKPSTSHFEIYAGLGGGFNSVRYCTTIEASEDEAMQYAYEEALIEYESYEGFHGLKSWSDCYEEVLEEFSAELGLDECDDSIDFDEIEREADEIYNAERESWIEYYVEEVV